MNREYDYSELIEDYLTGRLSEKQKLEFETQLEINPDLNKELILQKDIISSIKNTRKAELKSMLNNVNVSSGNGSNILPLQIAGALLISSLLAVGAYFYFSGDETVNEDRSPIYVETVPPNNAASEHDLTPVTPDDIRTPQDETTEQPEENTSAESSAVSTEEGSPETISGKEEQSTSGEDASLENNEASPTENINETGDNGLNVETKKDRNHAFHYQYYEDKLFLYGDFKGNKYEIIKIPTSAGTRLFMSYNGQFYKMEKSRKIQPFEKVEDPSLIEQLQKLKTK